MIAPGASGALQGGEALRGAPPADPAPARRAARRFLRNPAGVVALSFIVVMVVVAVFAPLLAPHPQAAQLGRPFQPPSGRFWLGTDDLGRDLFSRLIFGTRVSVRAGIQTVAMALV